jgi:CheY-like chemotaxis protein
MSEHSIEPQRSSWRILICDDNRAHLRMVKRLVMDMGVGHVMESPVRFGSAEPICQFQPHLVVGRVTKADRGMLELIKWLRNPELTPLPGISVLVSVGDASPQTLTLAVKAGADLLVAEPVTLGALKKRIDFLMAAPLPRIVTKNYIGPDRRRTLRTAYMGEDRRRRASAA